MTASTLVASSATLAERVRAEARDSFPVWLSVSFSISHVYSALTFFEPQRLSALGTVLFPLAWAAAYYHSERRQRQLDATALAALGATAPAMALLLWLPAWVAWDPGDPSGMRLAFELMVIAAAIALLLHCRRTRGWPGVVAFFGAAALYGLLQESSGLTLGYFSEPGYHMYVPCTVTPVAAVAGWCTIFYPSVFMAESIGAALPLRRHVATLALLTAAIGLSADLHFDPLATALGFWVWNERLTDAFLGVPLVNFTAWITALFAFAVVYFRIARSDWSVERKAVALVIAVPVMQLLAGVTNVALIATLEGPGGPSVGILRDFITRLLQGT